MMKTLNTTRILSVCVVFSAVLLSLAHQVHPTTPQAPQTEVNTIDINLYDVELVDQDGKKVLFKTDVIGDRVAVIIPFYTTCTTSYPILIFVFTRLQAMLADHLGKDVVLVSVSVDPRTDIPVRLKVYADRQKAKPGWVFLSGDRGNLAKVLFGIGILFSLNLDDHNHTPLTVVGSVHSKWKRFYGYPPPEVLMTQVNESLIARPDSGAKE